MCMQKRVYMYVYVCLGRILNSYLLRQKTVTRHFSVYILLGSFGLCPVRNKNTVWLNICRALYLLVERARGTIKIFLKGNF